MIKAFLFDFSRTLLFPKDKNYSGELNALHKLLSKKINYNFLDNFELDENLLSYLDSIKNKYDLYIFTSGSIQNAPEIKPIVDKIFKKIFSAEEIGLNKKDPKAYEYIAEQIGLTPDEILFVDDSKSNIEAAKLAGINTFLYSDYKLFRDKIENLLNSIIKINELKTKNINGFKVFYRNEDEFGRIYKEIFKNEEYKFVSKSDEPFIIDCGSHVGLSILYFKSIYPNSTIIGFEPNPENFRILQENIKENKLQDVGIFNYALSDRNGVTDLHVSFEKKNPWTWGDTIIYNMWGDEENDKKILVKTVRLSKYITKPVDLIKIDIEGSEQKVLQEIESKLSLVKEIIMEYHGTKTSVGVNDYSIIKNILNRNSFSVKAYDKDLRLAFPDFVANLRKTSSVFSVRAVRN